MADVCWIEVFLEHSGRSQDWADEMPSRLRTRGYC
jgi:hypothetical protein